MKFSALFLFLFLPGCVATPRTPELYGEALKEELRRMSEKHAIALEKLGQRRDGDINSLFRDLVVLAIYQGNFIEELQRELAKQDAMLRESNRLLSAK